MNLHEYMVFRDSSTRTVNRYLMSYEGQTIAVRQHPAVLLNPMLIVVGSLFLIGFLVLRTGVSILWILWLAALGWLVWKVIAWSVEFFIVTEHRVMRVNGVLNRNVAMIPLAKVTDIAFDRSLLGRMLGYGEFILESAGQQQAIRDVPFMPYPEQLYLEISALVFPAVDESPD